MIIITIIIIILIVKRWQVVFYDANFHTLLQKIFGDTGMIHFPVFSFLLQGDLDVNPGSSTTVNNNKIPLNILPYHN